MAEQTESHGPKGNFDKPVVYALAVLSLLLVGVGTFAYLSITRPKPSGESDQQPGRLVRVFEARKASHRLAITAYGTSRAAEVWTAIAEVKGRAVEVNPRFEPGEVLPAGTLLVRIEPTDYELARTRSEAEANAKQLQIDELNQSEEDLKEILKLQERQLELAKDEYVRQQELHAKNRAAPLSAVQAAENAYVMQLTAVQKARNTLSLVSVQRLRLQALLKAATVQMEQARRDLDRCEIRLPPELDARCASKSVEVDQFVASGERLGTFLALETAEVVALVETRKVAALLRGAGQTSGPLDLMEISREESLWSRFRIPVEVSWSMGEQRVPPRWGRLARIGSSLDPSTRTVPLIIEVRHPYKDIRPGVRPPLLPDVFCEVTAYGDTVDDVVVIPREALRQVAREGLGSEAEEDLKDEGSVDVVYLLDVEDSQRREGRMRRDKGDLPILAGQLRMAEVEVEALEESSAVISKGIETGDFVIVTDLFPASEKMRLRGEWLECPVEPRGELELPDDLFDEAEAAEDPPAEKFPADRPPAPAAAETR